jgi:hypothetical protein
VNGGRMAINYKSAELKFFTLVNGSRNLKTILDAPQNDETGKKISKKQVMPDFLKYLTCVYPRELNTGALHIERGLGNICWLV